MSPLFVACSALALAATEADPYVGTDASGNLHVNSSEFNGNEPGQKDEGYVDHVN